MAGTYTLSIVYYKPVSCEKESKFFDIEKKNTKNKKQKKNKSLDTEIHKGPGTRIHFFEIFLKFNEKHYFNNISTCSMKLFK